MVDVFHILGKDFGRKGIKLPPIMEKELSGIDLPLFPNLFLLFPLLLSKVKKYPSVEIRESGSISTC
jgi:hypothetical protein